MNVLVGVFCLVLGGIIWISSLPIFVSCIAFFNFFMLIPPVFALALLPGGMVATWAMGLIGVGLQLINKN